MKLIAKISMLLAATCFMVASCDPAEKPEGPGIVRDSRYRSPSYS